ncbi:MAG: hypothetical protein IPL88_06215 [Rhizobiales bacterium]|nr:hypothetical protein [Hyphomicrobiales bacterium]
MIRHALLFALIVATPAFADEPTPSPLPRPQASAPSIEGYGATNKACMEWTNGCQICVAGDKPGCSTPGVACTAGPIVCSKTK